MPKALVLYHYFHPDDVVSARHFSELAEGLALRGWSVAAMPCNRGCRDDSNEYPPIEFWRGIRIRRVRRPRFRQASTAGRLANAVWMTVAWSLAALQAGVDPPEVVIIGTDPILSVTAALFWKRIRPQTRIVHWCFDLYPEAAVADGLLQSDGFFTRSCGRLLRSAYGACDAIVDIGSCMQQKLAAYPSPAIRATLPPWAFIEPERPIEPDREEREMLFGNARMGLLYSGNFGRAHSHEELLTLARRLRGEDIRFVFSIRGNREQELRAAISADDSNIGFAPFASEDRLEQRLAAADIQVVSLREEWTGTVVPSKFFGAIAIGRPVIFAGSPDSAVARWIEQYKLGWVLNGSTVHKVAEDLRLIARSPAALRQLGEHCRRVYQDVFSRDRTIAQWDRLLRSILPADQLGEDRTHPGRTAVHS
jgi:colanic acid biosynthesis glycosyl transferase WcaI